MTVELVHSYEPVLFVASVIVAAFAGYVSLGLVGRGGGGGATRDARWLASASAAMGIGIWSMHFTGMLALRLPVRVGYDPGLTLLSAAIAVAVSLLALGVVRRETVGIVDLTAGAGLMGAAISGMHYTGMAAMRLPGDMTYRPGLVAGSVVVAVLASGAALWLFLRHREEESPIASRGKLLAAVVMGIAVSGMHYTGMAAARFEDLQQGASLPAGGLVFTDTLAGVVALGSAVLLALGLVAVRLDRGLRRGYLEELEDRRRRYETLLREISDVVSVLEPDGTIRYESPSIRHVFGHDPSDLEGRSAFELVHPDDVARVREAFAELLSAPGEEGTVQYRTRTADGAWRQVESTGVVPEHEDLGAVVVTRDITDRTEAQAKYRAIFDTNPSAVGLATLEEGRFVEVNDAFADLLGYPPEEVTGRTTTELGLWANPGERERIVARLRETGSVHHREVQFRTRDGEIVDVLFSGSILEMAGQRYLVGAAQDISERKAFEAELERRALHDGLTDLPNRSLFADRLRHALDRSEREGTGVAVLFLDVDRFKVVNDSLGHAVGDRVLRTVAARISNAIRRADTLARVGGDEFAVLLEGQASREEIEEAADRIQRAFEAPFTADGNDFSLSVSVGVAHSGLEIGSPDDLVRLADAAMYRSKRAGGKRVHVYDPEADRDVTERLQRESALQRAIEMGELVVHFQPIVRLDTGECVGAETLVRWDRPGRGLVFPGEFIPLAEDTGLIVPLGREVLRLALERVERWREAGLVTPGRFRVGVNLSAREYQEEDLVEAVLEATGDAGVPLEMLTLEITETIAITGRDRLRPLRERGLRLAIDDFGTGYSSLDYLRHLEADTLKVDRSFIAGLRERRRDEVIVNAILFLAREMGMDAVAEGVETGAQAAWLREAGCREAQGYHFARPGPDGELEELLRDGSSLS